MSGEVYQVKKSYLSEEALTLLTSLGVSSEQIEGGKIDLESIPPSGREIAKDIFMLSFLSEGDVRYDEKIINYSCAELNRFSRFFVSVDGNSKDFSKKDVEVFLQLKKADFKFVNYGPPTENSPNFSTSTLEKIGIKSMELSDKSIVFYVSDQDLFGSYDKYRTAILCDGGTSCASLDRIAFVDGGILNEVVDQGLSAEQVEKYVEYRAGLDKKINRKTKTPLMRRIEGDLKNLGVSKDEFVAAVSCGMKTSGVPEENLNNFVITRDLRAFEDGHLEVLGDALALAKVLKAKTLADFENIVTTYADLGYKKTQAALHYFVNPNLYPAPKGDGGLERGQISELEWVRLRLLFSPDLSGIPRGVQGATACVTPLNLEQEYAGWDNEGTASMVCLEIVDDGGRKYAIYATAEHVSSKVPKEYQNRIVADDVALVAIPIESDEEAPKAIKIGKDLNSSDKFIYTVNGRDEYEVGSDFEYTDDGGKLEFRALNQPGDSGGAVVDRSGRLVGLVLAGDKRLTVRAFSDMNLLKESLESFKYELSLKKMPENKTADIQN